VAVEVLGEGMTATPNFASDALTGAEASGATAPAASASPFVLHLCSSTTPMALTQTDLPELKRFTFFVSRRFEEGRERFRLHMGYFATLAEAEEWLTLVREIYPGAWAGEAPGRKLRERAAAAAAAQAQHAAGPQRQAAAPSVRASAPAVSAPARTAAVRPAPAPPRPAAQPPAMRVPVVHAAPPAAQRFAAAAPTAARATARPAARPPGSAPAPGAPAPAMQARAAPAPAPGARPAVRAPAPPAGTTRAAAAPAQRSAPPRPAAPRPGAPRPAAPRPGSPVRPGVTAAARPAPAAAAAGRPAPAAAAAGRPAPPAAAAAKPVFKDSNVREVLKALDDASATGETRLMHAPPAPRVATTAEHSSLSDTGVLKLLETRRAETSEPSPPEVMDTDGGIPLLKPDDTGTRQALKEAVASNAPVSFAVQLQWSVQPVELDKVPPLAIFSAYTLYTVEGSRDGRKWYGLRLGFFSDAISAKQVAYYVRSEFTSVAVVPVSPQEKGRASDQDKAAAFTGPAPAAAEDPMDEFKLFDDNHPASAPSVLAPSARAAAAGGAAKPQPRVAAGAGAGQARTRGKVGARDSRGPQTLEETLEILGASQLTIEPEGSTTINDSGVRHLRVEVQKNSPFSKLLERLSERLKKP
jgi:hypothetical protein